MYVCLSVCGLLWNTSIYSKLFACQLLSHLKRNDRIPDTVNADIHGNTRETSLQIWLIFVDNSVRCSGVLQRILFLNICIFWLCMLYSFAQIVNQVDLYKMIWIVCNWNSNGKSDIDYFYYVYIINCNLHELFSLAVQLGYIIYGKIIE